MPGVRGGRDRSGEGGQAGSGAAGMRKASLATAAAVLAMVLAACGGSPGVAGSTVPVESPSVVEPAPESTATLAAMKKAAGIAACPASDPKVAPVPSGLPDVVLPCLGGGRQ